VHWAGVEQPARVEVAPLRHSAVAPSSHCQHKCRQPGAIPFQTQNGQRWEIGPISPRR
jgi:hypothetical protein